MRPASPFRPGLSKRQREDNAHRRALEAARDAYCGSPAHLAQMARDARLSVSRIEECEL